MNENIKKLILQCNFTEEDINELSPGLEKCIELAVKECISLAKNKADAMVEYAEKWAVDEEELDAVKATAWQFEVLGQEIKEYFGVK